MILKFFLYFPGTIASVIASFLDRPSTFIGERITFINIKINIFKNDIFIKTFFEISYRDHFVSPPNFKFLYLFLMHPDLLFQYNTYQLAYRYLKQEWNWKEYNLPDKDWIYRKVQYHTGRNIFPYPLSPSCRR